MDFKQIQELIKMVNKSNIGEVTIEEKGFKVIIKQKEEPVQNYITGGSPMPVSYAPQPQQQLGQGGGPRAWLALRQSQTCSRSNGVSSQKQAFSRFLLVNSQSKQSRSGRYKGKAGSSSRTPRHRL